ncbi:MAG: UGSC family (seleno)protein, partial [Pseudomonadales bacterium]|nr:UGSC family (seleno)protein [Pseudomonadales bacterium]
MTELLNASDEAEALEDLHRRGLTDGLPVIIPTPARVTRMVLASGFDADMVLGAMGPGHGIATIEKVAVAAVMSGCLPDYMPVVLAAVKAVIDPIFDLTEMQATTHCTAPLIIVNGPARHT